MLHLVMCSKFIYHLLGYAPGLTVQLLIKNPPPNVIVYRGVMVDKVLVLIRFTISL